jgi:hypothetical protein
MPKFFNIDDLQQQTEATGKPDKSGILVEKFLQLHERRIESIKDLAGRIPLEDEIFFLWTVNSFNAFTFIPYIIKECGVIEELVIATYSINIRIINSLIRLIDKQLIVSVVIIISDSIRQTNTKVYDHLLSVTGPKPIRVIYAWNHAKVALIRAGGNFFDVEGSGNWAENAQHEQYILLNSKRVFEFRKNEIINGINARTD